MFNSEAFIKLTLDWLLRRYKKQQKVTRNLTCSQAFMKADQLYS